MTINGGLGGDTVEFTGDYLVPNSSLTVNAEHIKVDAGVAINVGSASGNNITFNAVYKDNGLSLLGITTTIPVLGVDALVDINGATLTANKISLNAFAGTLATTVNGGSQTLGTELIVDSVAGFDNSNGDFTVVGVTGTCHYTGRDTSLNKLTGITGCSGSPADGAGLELGPHGERQRQGCQSRRDGARVYANVNVYGASALNAAGNVTLASQVDVTATANATPVKGNWVSGTSYLKNDVVIDTTDGKRYSAKNNMASSTTAPHADSGNWDDASGHDSAIAASTLISHAISRLSDTATISSTGGDVTISSNLESNVTTTGNATKAARAPASRPPSS